MQVYRPVLTQHRLQRFALWGVAMLTWMAAVLFGGRPLRWRDIARCEDNTVRGVEQMVVGLMIERALNIVRTRLPRRRIHYWRRGRDLRRRHWVRSLIGSKLRRVLKHRDVATQIAQLIGVLRNLDKYAHQLALRMRTGLRRLWSTVPRIAVSAILLGAPAPSPAVADSS